jgi:acyl-CoA thioesterase I
MTRAYTDDQRRHFLRYTRTQRWPMLERFPISDELHTDLLAQMLSCSPADVRALLAGLHDETRETAGRLLRDDDYRTAVGGLPFETGSSVVAVGDSITADRLGWFELLAASIERTGGPPGALHNLAVSGNTTADVIERFDLVEAARPTHVLLMLGTNDARAHGRSATHRMITGAETERNLRTLVDLITADLRATVTVMTPPAVDQDRITEYFTGQPVHWDAASVEEVAAVVRKVVPDSVDLYAATSGRHRVDLLESDGVHPSAAGQQVLLRHIVHHLAGGRARPRTWTIRPSGTADRSIMDR